MAALVHDDLGEGPPLLLIHAYPLDGRIWDEQRHVLSRVSRLLIPDCRGFGRSADLGPGPTLEDHARDMAMILDHQRIDRAFIAGISMGGYIALAFLELFPERVSGLVLANTRSQADTEEQRTVRLATAERAEAVGIDAVVQGLPEKMLSEYTRRECPDLIAKLSGIMQDQKPEGVAAAQRAMAARPDRTGVVARAACPVLVIAGDSDPLIPMSDTKAMADASPRARLVVVPHTAHLSNYESPAHVNEELIRFVTAG